MNNTEIEALCDDIHASNVAAGWWSDKDTGESILATRNRGEMMMLMVSELSEADEGRQGNLMDDKLPHLRMFDVELADFAIRVLDGIGAERSLRGDDNGDFKFFRSQVLASVGAVAGLFGLVNGISRAMEHHRKGRVAHYRETLIRALADLVAYAQNQGVDLWPIVAAKRHYNATRPDHKIENRRKAGGKAY